MIFINIILVILFTYLTASVLYVFVFSIAGRIGSLNKIPLTNVQHKFAVIIPSYKEDEVIIESARQALNQNYSKDKYDVIVIADSLKQESIKLLRSLPLKLVEVSFEVSTKSKSIKKALEKLPEVYDYALILDADNIMANDFLEKINAVFVKTQAKVVQGHRVAKNLNTKFAVLDAISEEINNHVFRKGHRVMGLSCALIGSGMAFEFNYFKYLMSSNQAVGGFDRELELKILFEGVKMEYAENAMVYDEKVENAEVFQNQRKRWMSAQMHYLSRYFLKGFKQLILKGNVDFFDKVFQQMLLPRVLLLAALSFLLFFTVALQLFFALNVAPEATASGILLGVYVMGLLVAVPNHYYNKKTLNAILSLPKAILVMLSTLFKLKGANKKFIHTPHSGTMDRSIYVEKK